MVRTVHPTIAIPAEVPATWHQRVLSFRRALHAENRAPGTIHTYTHTIHEFARFLVWRELPTAPEDIRREHVQAYIGWLLDHLKASTVITRYAELHGFFTWLLSEEIAEHPMARMRRPTHEPEPGSVLPEEAIRALLKVCEGKGFEERRDTAIMRLLLDTGMRRAELVGICLDDLDLDEQEVRVLGKGRRYRVAAFGAKATRAVDTYLRLRARHPKAGDTPRLFLTAKGAWASAASAICCSAVPSRPVSSSICSPTVPAHLRRSEHRAGQKRIVCDGARGLAVGDGDAPVWRGQPGATGAQELQGGKYRGCVLNRLRPPKAARGPLYIGL
ncbi:MAG TPA: phage integrase N-terminal SAM-like domain-containing protein [Ktedonobacterales bacterium]|nr:phage integrase N-terminal SAM-like domain-containing protein [Ktedonobacterales bacterium]